MRILILAVCLLGLSVACSGGSKDPPPPSAVAGVSVVVPTSTPAPVPTPTAVPFAKCTTNTPVLPANIRRFTPPAGTHPDVVALAAAPVWEGKWGETLDSKIMVLSVEGATVRMVYAYGSNSQVPTPAGNELQAQILEDGSLQFGQGTAQSARFRFKLNPDRTSVAGSRTVDGFQPTLITLTPCSL